MKSTRPRSEHLLLLWLILAPSLIAQDFGITWFSMDGGGGTSLGGEFVVRGTIGQPDAGQLTGGDFLLVGGFEVTIQSGLSFLRGDVNGDAIFNGLVDTLHLLEFQFQGGPMPPCLEAADSDGDGVQNGLVDALFILEHQFQGGPPPPTPYPNCGPDPDLGHTLGCEIGACP